MFELNCVDDIGMPLVREPSLTGKLLTVCLLAVVLSGCSGGTGSHSGSAALISDSSADLAQYSYLEQPGDVFTYSERATTEISGQCFDTDSIRETVFTQVLDIPLHYGYSGQDPGPYLLKTTLIDGEIAGRIYTGRHGQTILDDDCEIYSCADCCTLEGDDQPSTVYFGRQYSFSSSCTLFSSTSGEPVGVRTIEMKIQPLGIVSLSVPAGLFSSLEFETTSLVRHQVHGSEGTSTITGTIWYGEHIGPIKTQLDYSIQTADLTIHRSFLSELISIHHEAGAESFRTAPPAPEKTPARFVSGFLHPDVFPEFIASDQ